MRSESCAKRQLVPERPIVSPAARQDTMSDIELSAETTRRLDALFSGPMRQAAAELLMTQCGANLPFNENADANRLERIRFAALKLSQGDLGKLASAVQRAQVDWRDVLVAAGFGNDIHAHQSWFPEHEHEAGEA